MSDSRKNHVTRTSQISSCKSESTFWKKEYTNKINYHIIMFWFCGFSNLIASWWCGARKKILELKLEKIFSTHRLAMMRDDSWLLELEVIHLFVSFCSFCVKETKKKWDYKRERSKEKIFNKKREKIYKEEIIITKLI